MKKMFVGFLFLGIFFTMLQAKAQVCNACCDEEGFEGFYLGGNLGVDSHLAHRNDLDGFLTDNSGWSTLDTNVTLGVQLGYDWLCGYKLFGLVVDWNWANHDKKIRDNPNADSDNFIRSEFDWFTTIRARAGLTVCDALLYITAGAAVARVETKWHDAPDRFSDSHSRWGWTGGAGAEFLCWCNWSLGAEVLFLHFGDKHSTFSSGDTHYAFGHSDSAWVGRLVLNYRFGDLCSWCCR